MDGRAFVDSGLGFHDIGLTIFLNLRCARLFCGVDSQYRLNSALTPDAL